MQQLNGQLVSRFIERTIFPLAQILSSNKHLIAIREGFQMTMPFVVIGSLFIPLLYPPFDLANYPNIAEFLRLNHGSFQYILRHTFGLVALFLAFGVSASLAKQYQIPERLSGLTGSLSFLMLTGVMNMPQNGNFLGGSNNYLGGNGLFTALIAAIYSVEVIRFFYQKKWVFQLPDEVPLLTRRSFDLMSPLLFIVISLSVFNTVLKQTTGYYLPDLITSLFQPLIMATDTLTAILLAVFLCQLLWFTGIHGAVVVTGIMNPFWFAGLIANQEAIAAGIEPSHFFVQGFWDYFLLIGGVGSTLPLAFMALRSKNKQLQSIGKVSLIPSIFNINEPIIFGFPIIMNPLFLLPFICVPMLNAVITWHLMQFGVLDVFVTMLPWSMPAPIGASLAANGSLNNMLACLFAIFVSWALYRPFFKAHEKQLMIQQQERENNKKAMFRY